jgi:hypothetical protein
MAGERRLGAYGTASPLRDSATGPPERWAQSLFTWTDASRTIPIGAQSRSDPVGAENVIRVL